MSGETLGKKQPGKEWVVEVVQAKDQQPHGAGLVFEHHHPQQAQVEQGQDAAVEPDQATSFTQQRARLWRRPAD